MASLRQLMQQNPMVGWGIAALLILAAAVAISFQFLHRNETEQLTQVITIRDSETGDEWKIPRGVMEKELYLRKYPVDPNQGLINPKTGKPNGFPVDAWKETVTRVNAERKTVEDPRSASAAPEAPSAPRAPSAPSGK